MIPYRREPFALPLPPLSSVGSGRHAPQRVPSFDVRRPIALRAAFRLGGICSAHCFTEDTGPAPTVALRADSIFTASRRSGARDCGRVARRDHENHL